MTSANTESVWRFLWRNKRLLWKKLKEDFSREVAAPGFKGKVQFFCWGVQTVFTSIVPFSEPLNPFINYLMGVLQRSIFRTYEDSLARENWMQGTYNVRTTKSGLTILERPKLWVPPQAGLQVPSQLEIPSQALIRPPLNLQYRGWMKQRLQGKPPARPAATLTPLEALKLQSTSAKPRQRAGVNQLLSKYSVDSPRQIGSIDYPSWFFDSSLMPRRKGTTLSGKRTNTTLSGKRTTETLGTPNLYNFLFAQERRRLGPVEPYQVQKTFVDFGRGAATSGDQVWTPTLRTKARPIRAVFRERPRQAAQNRGKQVKWKNAWMRKARVERYYPRLGVMQMMLPGVIAIGDAVKIEGKDTSFVQKVQQMRVNRKPVQAARDGQTITIKVDSACRKGAYVSKLVRVE